MSQASALMSVHAFELYGFGRPQLEQTFALYGLDPHLHCGDLLNFCRNPLHPGPCKGWKHSLKAIAPDVHAEKERKRLEQVHARREAKRRAARDAGLPEPRFRKLKHERTGPVDRKGQGEGRDGDGDGLKGEGEYEKKGRKKAAPKPPAEKHLVTLSPEALKTVNDAVKALPKSDDEWRGLVEERSVRDPFRDLVATNLDQLIEARRNLTSSQDRFLERVNSGRKRRGLPLYADWNDLARNEPDLADEWTKYDGAALARQVVDADQRYGHTKDALDQAEAEIARLGGRKPDGTVPSGFTPPQGFRARNFEHVTEYRKRAFPRDAAGRELPPPELVAMHEKVLAAGKALRVAIGNATAGDKERRRLEGRLKEIVDTVYTVTGDARKALQAERTQVGTDLKRREREMIMDALRQLRPMGGVKHENVKPLTSQNDIMMNVDGSNASSYTPAPPNWQEQLDEAAAHFPDDWMRRASQSPMMVVAIDRAHMDSRGDWRRPLGPGRFGIMAMDRENADSAGGTAFATYGGEVTYHENGHWMEANIPGLKALQFAFVRSKTTHNGQVEPLVKLADKYGGSYAASEVSFEDNFSNLYTGKTYEVSTGDPANSHWEAFQVGLQQVIARHSDYGGVDLEDFVLGTLATLGRY